MRQPAFVGKGARPEQTTYNLDGVAISLGGIIADLLRLRCVQQHRGDDRRLRPLARDARRGCQPRDQARHQRASGLGPRLSTPAARVGTTGSRPAARSGRTASGSGAPSRTTSSRARPSSNRPAEPVRESADSQALEREAQRPAHRRQRAHVCLHQLRESGRGIALRWSDPSAEATWTERSAPGSHSELEDSQVLSANLFASFYFAYVKAAPSNLPVGGLDEQADQDDEGVWRHSYKTRLILR